MQLHEVSFNPLVIGSIFQTPPNETLDLFESDGFQSPSNRVNIPNLDFSSEHQSTRLPLRFNPLVIGSIFQTQMVFDQRMMSFVRFQSPSNRVNIPNVMVTGLEVPEKVARFNPLVIGSIFQTPIRRMSRCNSTR